MVSWIRNMVSSVMSQHISCATVVMAKTGIDSGTSSNGFNKDSQFNQGCKNLGYLKKVFRFYRFYRFFCTKTEHNSTTQKHMRKKNIPYMVRPSPSHGLQHTKLQASTITSTEYTTNSRPNIKI